MDLSRVISEIFNVENRLRNDLYCVEWDVKLYYTIPMSKNIATFKSWSRVNQGHWMWYHSI